MFKLQVVLVPPSLQNAAVPFGFASSTADSSQLLGTAPMMGSAIQRNGDTTLPYVPSITAANTTIFPNHLAQIKRRKFLHFTKSGNSLLELASEIIEKCDKMYPSLDEEIEILSLQDNSGCDLDPDFLVKDVFNIDNTVRVVLKNELNIDDSTPVSLYRNNNKRQKLDGGRIGHLPQPQPLPRSQSLAISQSQSQYQIPGSSGPSSSGVLKIAKKRPSGSGIRHPTNSNMRISTPLAHQIYPSPHADQRAVSNNSEDEDAAERSFLPPPAQPQSPPIRISSGIGNGKKIRSAIEEDAVSRSETVDPDKNKQQRLLSGTPIRNTMTPNRVTLTGQRVVSDRLNNKNRSIFSANALSTNRRTSSANMRIISGMLTIPEPKISEVEKQLREGPSSPSSVLPAVPHRIPMKKPYQARASRPSDDEISSSDDQETDSQVKASVQRQTSIADNNGSPVKDISNGENGLHNFNLPELPRNVRSEPKTQRETSLEAKVQKKMISAFNQTQDEEEPLRKESFSDDDDDDDEAQKEQEEEDQEMESEIGIIDSHEKDAVKDGIADQRDDEDKYQNNLGEAEQEVNDDEYEDEEDTVLINRTSLEKKTSANTSIQKEEFLKYMEGDSNETPSWYPKHSQAHNTQKSKPYTTVLYNDIDNSKPDPRNIMPKRIPRDAARKAAELLSGKQMPRSDTDDQSASSFDSSSSGIETDEGFEDEDDRISVTENNNIRRLRIHPLKEKVIAGSEVDDDANASSESPSTESEYSEEEATQSKISSEEFNSNISNKPNNVGVVESETNQPQHENKEKEVLKTTKNSVSSGSIGQKNDVSAINFQAKNTENPSKKEKSILETTKGLVEKNGASTSQEKETEANAGRKAQAKADKEAKAKADKEAKAQAAKAKAEKGAEATAERGLKANQEKAAEAKAKAERDLKAKQEKSAEAKAKKERDLRSKQEKEVEAAKAIKEKELKAKQEKEANPKAGNEAKQKTKVKSPAKPTKEAKDRIEKGNAKPQERQPKKILEKAGKQKLNSEGNLIVHSKREENNISQKIKTVVSENSDASNADAITKSSKEAHETGNAASLLTTDGSDLNLEDKQKLQELKAKFTKARTYVPVGLVSQKISRSESGSSETSDSSEEASSSEYSSSSSDEDDSPKLKSTKRVIVDTPKGSLNLNSKKAFSKKPNGVEDAPQSTQKEEDEQSTPDRVPITKLMEVSSPLSANAGSPKSRSIFHGLPQKVRPSLSSLSDLASRGVPDVREKGMQSSQLSSSTTRELKKNEQTSSDDNSGSDSDSESDSIDSESDSGSSSSSEDNSFISAKTASTALGKKKKNNGGFASLIKDFKRG